MKDSCASYESFFRENEKKIKRADSTSKKQQHEFRNLLKEHDILIAEKNRLEREKCAKAKECDNLIENEKFLNDATFVFNFLENL